MELKLKFELLKGAACRIMLILPAKRRRSVKKELILHEKASFLRKNNGYFFRRVII